MACCAATCAATFVAPAVKISPAVASAPGASSPPICCATYARADASRTSPISPPCIAVSAPATKGKAHACPDAAAAIYAICLIGSSSIFLYASSRGSTIASSIVSTAHSPTSSTVSPIHLIGLLTAFVTFLAVFLTLRTTALMQLNLLKALCLFW